MIISLDIGGSAIKGGIATLGNGYRSYGSPSDAQG